MARVCEELARVEAPPAIDASASAVRATVAFNAVPIIAISSVPTTCTLAVRSPSATRSSVSTESRNGTTIDREIISPSSVATAMPRSRIATSPTTAWV